MKSTGIIRYLDELGRIVIPMEIRKQIDISHKDKMEIFLDGKNMILKKYERNCVFCRKTNNLVSYNDKLVCKSCIQKLLNVKK